MDVIAAGCLSMAILCLGLAFGRSSPKNSGARPLLERLTAHYRRRLAEARIAGNPLTYVAMAFLTPICLFAIGWLQIGRASCRERVLASGVSGSLEEKYV